MEDREDLRALEVKALVTRVFEDAGLYRIRHKSGLMDYLGVLFLYTKKQKEALMEALEKD